MSARDALPRLLSWAGLVLALLFTFSIVAFAGPAPLWKTTDGVKKLDGIEAHSHR